MSHNQTVLIIGSGGREHALGYNLALDEVVSEVLYAPGNAGTALEKKGRNIAIDITDFSSIANLIEAKDINLTVVGPEQPLADGFVDYLNSIGYDKAFGPVKKGALLESDKFFSYMIMGSIGIPQADSALCFTKEEAIAEIKKRTTKEGIVIKARGLTAGKGVSVCSSLEEALTEIEIHSERYGPEVLISERLSGEEFSVFGISDGNNVYPINVSFQDHKLAYDGDKGPNTGGMGAYGPAPVAPEIVVRDIANTVMTPVVQEMARIGSPYKGFFYAGMILTEDGPKVIEFNVRFGDPECQPAMMVLKDSLYQPLSLALEGKLDQLKIDFRPGASCCVVLASKGYPGSYKKGSRILGIDEANAIDGVKVFHAGTKFDESGNIVTEGGRVLGVTSYSSLGIADAKISAYDGVSEIIKHSPGIFHYRKDIADKAIKRIG